MSEVYLNQITKVIPRLFSLYDNDPTSNYYGIGDRFRWGWKLIDFGNGTFQGVVHGLSILINQNVVPFNLSKEKILSRIDSVFMGAKNLMRKNGSYEEAFPYESSYCVSALVAFDLLSAIENLGNILTDKTRNEYLSIIEPTIHFLYKSEETHAFISNHLATASAAHIKWGLLTNENKKGTQKGEKILSSILDKQSTEGWYLEYEGADPGYQSLCTYYLADIYRMTEQKELLESLKKSVNFLLYFAHPDGSFGGIYGSRNTRFYYPGGIEFLGQYMEEAKILAQFMRTSIQNYTTVILDSIDSYNLIPMFNSYCYALQYNHLGETKDTVPSLKTNNERIHFSEAGILVDIGVNHYTILSIKKGGVCYHFSKDKLIELDSGTIIEYKNKKYSSQIFNSNVLYNLEKNQLVISTQLYANTQKLPTIIEFIILRLLNLTLMRIESLSKLIKKLLVALLITRKDKSQHTVKRTISLGEDLIIKDEIEGKASYKLLNSKKLYYAIHMASQGYWQIQDDR